MTQLSRRGFKRELRVCYPAETGTVVLRTELDWGRDIHPTELGSDGATASFEVEAQKPFVYFKPCLIQNGRLHWAAGPNNLLIMAAEDPRTIYPYFFSDPRGHFLPLIEIESSLLMFFRTPRTMRKPGACDCTCRCSCLLVRSRAPRAAVLRC